MSEQHDTRRVHMLVPVGDGGVFQHGVEVARLLDQAGVPVTLHVSDTHEPIDFGAIDVCRCVHWRWKRGWRRRAAVVLSYLFVTQPHLARVVRPGEIFHMEGLFYTPLTWLTMAGARLTGRRVVHSPHNTFSRGGAWWDRRFARALTLVASCSIVFSRADERVIAELGRRAFLSPLVQVVPLDPALVARWRARWRDVGAQQVVLLAGQIRRDKRPDLLVRSAVGWPDGRVVAFAGEDKGAWRSACDLAEQLGVKVESDVGYLGLDDFTAALAAADVVVCPYDQASQSGVISISRSVGTPTVASAVGGIGEAADVAVPPGDPAALARGIETALGITPADSAADQDKTALDAHLAAYAASEPARGLAGVRAVLRSFR